jgi:hypothetical protein
VGHALARNCRALTDLRSRAGGWGYWAVVDIDHVRSLDAKYRSRRSILNFGRRGWRPARGAYAAAAPVTEASALSTASAVSSGAKQEVRGRHRGQHHLFRIAQFADLARLNRVGFRESISL